MRSPCERANSGSPPKCGSCRSPPAILPPDGTCRPGFALDQHDLAAAAATAVPGPQQQPHLLLASDKGCRAPGPCRSKAALDIPRRQDAPDRYRLGGVDEDLG